MSKVKQTWYIRLPDGRVVRANSTASVRHHLQSGTFPASIMIRRKSETKWVTPEYIDEFADLVPRAEEAALGASPPGSNGTTESIAPNATMSRIDPLRLQTIGIRGVIEEMAAAVDSAMSRDKFRIALLGGIFTLLAGTALVWSLPRLVTMPAYLLNTVFAMILTLGFASVMAAVARLTHLEESLLRPAHWNEVRHGFGAILRRLLPIMVLMPGIPWFLLMLMSNFPQWVVEAMPDAFRLQLVGGVVNVHNLLAGVICWLLVGLSVLLVPIVVVEEELGLSGVLGRWWRIVRDNPEQVFLFGVLVLLFTFVLASPILLTLSQVQGITLMGAATLITQFTADALLGLGLAPALAFFGTATTFIYLNLQYQHSARLR